MQLGVDLGFFPEEYRAVIDELFIETQPAHLQKDFEHKLTTEERDALARRAYAREAETVPEPDIDQTADDLAKPDADEKKNR